MKKTLMISIFPILVFILIRILIPPLNSSEDYLKTLPYQLKLVHLDNTEYSLEFLLTQLAMTKLSDFTFGFLYKITVYTFMVHFILSFFDINTLKKWFFRFLPFIILIYFQIFFAVNDERVVVISFIPFLIFSIAVLNKILSSFPYKGFSLIFINSVFYLVVLNSGLYYGNWLIIRQIIFVFVFVIILFLITKFRMKYFNFKRNLVQYSVLIE